MAPPLKFRALLAAVACGLLLASCDFLGDDPDSLSGDLVPLVVGNYWIYSGWYIDPSLFADTFRVDIAREVEVLVGRRTVTAYAKTRRPHRATGPAPYAWLLVNGPGGLMEFGGVSARDTFVVHDNLSRKYPGNPGDSWHTNRLGYRFSTQQFEILDEVEVRIVATDSLLVTPAGSFRCYVYNYIIRMAEDVGSYWSVYEFYAPGVGMVGEFLKGRDPRGKEDDEPLQVTILQQYHVETDSTAGMAPEEARISVTDLHSRPRSISSDDSQIMSYPLTTRKRP